METESSVFDKLMESKLKKTKKSYFKRTEVEKKTQKIKVLNFLISLGFQDQFEEFKNLLFQRNFVRKCILLLLYSSKGKILQRYNFDSILKGGDKMSSERQRIAFEMKEINIYQLSQEAIFKFRHWGDRQIATFCKYYSQLADIREVIHHPLEKQFRDNL